MTTHLTPTAVIDLGTEKCVTLIGGWDTSTQSLRVLGFAAVPSRGMKKSQIVNLEEVLNCLSDSLDAAERMAGIEIKRVVVSVSGSHIHSQNSKGVVAVADPTREITHDDVHRVLEAARAVSLPAGQQIIHVVPRDFTVDAQTGIKDPVGMTGIRLEAETHIITAQSTSLRNLTKTVQDLGLELQGFVFSGLAAAEVALTETEKELGVVMVDIGAGTTSVCAYVEGSLAHSAVLPIGARHITSDVALGFRMSLEAAEKLKTSLKDDDLRSFKPHSSESKEEIRKRKKKEDELILSDLGITQGPESVSRRMLIEGIMMPRMKEICQLIGEELDRHNLLSLVPAGLVISGGGAETVGLMEVVRTVLNLPARTAYVERIDGLVDDVHKSAFVVGAGTLAWSVRHFKTPPPSPVFDAGKLFKDFNVGKLPELFKQLLKSILP
jgi:cell division protein FtsA